MLYDPGPTFVDESGPGQDLDDKRLVLCHRKCSASADNDADLQGVRGPSSLGVEINGWLFEASW